MSGIFPDSQKGRPLSAGQPAAILLRSVSLFAILCQFRLLAGDLADTPVFTASLFAAFAAAAVLTRFGLKPLPALVSMALIPWVTRFLISLPRFFIPNHAGYTAVVLDSLLLNLDRNNFVAMLPFYWAAATTYFSVRSRQFLRGSIVADAALLLVVFSIARTADIILYRWPVVMISLFAAIVFFQAIALMLSLPPELHLRKRETIPAAALILFLIFIGGFLFLRPVQERAVEKGGGLLEPKLFSFDFSQFLRLDSEISMNDDLVLIVKKDSDDDHILLRRSVLSGYSRKQGFYRLEGLDEKNHPQKLPDGPVRLDDKNILPPVKLSRLTNQEYFLVNFDAAAFIGMNDPLEVIPFENWDASSFNSAYAVQSRTSDAMPFELSDAADWPPGAESLGLSAEEYRIYTEYGGDERIQAYAREITRGLDNYGDKVQAIHDRLKFGEYRYSLKPGIAPDGDQLSFFLFQSKKGYCSYYAFACTLLLRSLGIPARVAAGFFLDPQTNTFDYYPVRSDMAHAWVEVPFPGYGWIEYDPTSQQLAEGEEFRFSSGVPQEVFERLMKEILDNHSRLRPRQGKDAAAPSSVIAGMAKNAAELVKRYWLPLLCIILIAAFLIIRCGFLFAFLLCTKKRKKAILLWNHAQRRLALAGFRKASFKAAGGALSEAEWARKLAAHIAGTYTLYQGAAAARFAPDYTDENLAAQRANYRAFQAAYTGAAAPGRRFLAWILPPLALVLGPGRAKKAGTLLLLIIFLALGSSGTEAQNDPPSQLMEDEEALFDNAMDAMNAENWERAIALFSRGNELFPWDYRFPWTLANLYYSRGLYGLAWDEYRKAEQILPDDPDILFRLSRTAAYLNRDAVSVDYLERLLDADPDNREAIGNLGWMYYKVHRLGDGVRLLTAAIERFGDDTDFAMTLGTLYSDMYRYNEGKIWYGRAIDAGEAVGDRIFTAVAHYNLSILESRFYHYDLAMNETNASLNSQNRASGRLARGELYLRRMEFSRALSDYETAYEIDTAPLSKMNLAQIYQISGRLEEARLYAEDCLKAGDLSWMLNYGIDPVRYKRDIHEILCKTYKGLAGVEQFMTYGRPGEKIQSLFRKISYRFKYTVNRHLYQKYSLAAGDAYGVEIYEGGGPHLDSFIQYYNAFESYPRRAITYLNRARNFESTLIPQAAPSYDLEEGILLKNENRIAAALEGFDSLWEREMVSKCYEEFAKHGKREIRAEAAERLFTINRGSPRQQGISIPANLRFENADANSAAPLRIEKKIARLLKKSGFAATKAAAAAPARFTLTITMSGAVSAGSLAMNCELIDEEQGTGILRRTFPVKSLSTPDISDFVRALGDAVFRE
ncbi:MAG: hypothetical protein LBN21_00430 [Treponema sp.]|jgi:tetratricopeptide (TPR) repeat protein|nr:hypothetical protein [Treponema sp.]